MRPTHLHALRLSDETIKLVSQAFAATDLTLKLRGQPGRTNVDSVLNEALQAYLHHQTKALQRAGGTWQMVLDDIEERKRRRRTGEKQSQRPAERAEDGDVIEE